MKDGYKVELYHATPTSRVKVFSTLTGGLINQLVPTNQTSTYEITENGFKLDTMTDEQYDALEYSIFKGALTKEIDSYLNQVTPEELNNIGKNLVTKNKVLNAIISLKDEDVTAEYKELYDMILYGHDLTVAPEIIVPPASADTLEVNLNRQQVNGKTMQLLLEDVDLIAKAYQISLKINGNVKLDNLNFSHAGNSDVTSTYVYDEAANEVDIYVTSTKSLLDANDNLNIGSITLNGTVGESFDVVPVANSFKIVTMANVEHSISTVSVSGGSDFSIQDTNNDSSDGDNTGGTVDKPSNSDNKFTVDLEGLDEAIKEKVDSIVLEVVTKDGGFVLSVDGDKEDLNNVTNVSVNSKGIFLTVGNTNVKVTDQLPVTTIDFTNARAIRVTDDKVATVSHYIDGDTLKITSNNLKDVFITSRIVASFDDVAETDWYYHDVQDIFNYVITQGTTSTTYSPLDHITRAQFATMIARALELTHTDIDSPYTLSDLTDKWYANDVQTLVDLGIITGYKDGTFGGENKLTRQQAVAMIARMLEYMDVDTTPKENVAFGDMDLISDYAKDAVQYLASHGVLNSGEDTKFNPYNNLTRAQMAKVLMRSLRLSDRY